MLWFHAAHCDSLLFPVISFPTRRCWARIFQFKSNFSQLVAVGHLFIFTFVSILKLSAYSFIFLLPLCYNTPFLLHGLSPDFNELVHQVLLSCFFCCCFSSDIMFVSHNQTLFTDADELLPLTNSVPFPSL